MKVYSGTYAGQYRVVFAGTQKSLREKLRISQKEFSDFYCLVENAKEDLILITHKNPGVVFVERQRYSKSLGVYQYDYISWDEFKLLDKEKREKWLKWETKRDE